MFNLFNKKNENNKAIDKSKSTSNNINGGEGGLSNFSKGAASAIPFLGTISSIIPQETWDKTLGAIFSNGFNLKCWGSSWNPTKGEKVFLVESEKIKQKLNLVLLANNAAEFQTQLNSFWKYFYGIRSTERNWLKTSAKDCTKDGLSVLIGALDGLAAQIRNTISENSKAKGLNASISTPLTVTYPPEPETGRHSLTYKVPQYKVSGGSKIIGGGLNKASFGLGIGLLFLAIGIGTWYYGRKMKKNGN
jgi:hypothetical protein